MEPTSHLHEYSGALFRNQRRLTRERVFSLGEPYLPRDELEACIASPETEAKLQDDIAWAHEHKAHGTPMVLINGRKAIASPGFIYAILLAGGDPSHPAFARLER
jgi:serine/threonine-protein kinase